MSRIAAIHQPNFFPWLGFFNKIALADVFVVLDDVQYQKTGSSWSNRVKLLLDGEARWVTAPVRRPEHGVQRLDEVLWANQLWRGKLLKTMRLHYARAPFFSEAIRLLEPLVNLDEQHVAAYNLHAIRAIVSALGLSAQVVTASSFDVQAVATQRLIELVRAVGCDTYLSGGGAASYQNDALFEAAGLRLQYQSFVHPVYPQRGKGAFVPGLSVVDSLMNCGITLTRKLVIS